MDSEQENLITADLGTTDYNQSTTLTGSIDWSKGAAIGIYNPNTIYTTNTIHPTITNTTYTPGSWSLFPDTNTHSTTVVIDDKGIKLPDGASIVVQGQDLIERIQKIEERLAIINPNTELEKNWPQLQEAAQNYRKLEEEFAKKQKVWNRLNTPLPKDNK